jgi:hypothetical protein
MTRDDPQPGFTLGSITEMNDTLSEDHIEDFEALPNIFANFAFIRPEYSWMEMRESTSRHM